MTCTGESALPIMGGTDSVGACDSGQSGAKCLESSSRPGATMPGETRRTTDRRTQRSRRLLREALVSLIHEKPYDAIVVKEILHRAAVGRSTFYAHFDNKDDLLLDGIHEILRSTPAASFSAASRSKSVVWFSRPLFEYVDRHRHEHSGGVGPSGQPIVHEHLQRVLGELVGDGLRSCVRNDRSASCPMPLDLVSRHVTATFILVLNWWVDTRSALSAKEVDRLFQALIAPALSATLD